MNLPISISPLNAIIQADVNAAEDKILTNTIDPWIFYNSHGVNILKANGKQISIKGVEFSGSASDVYWSGFADEWIQKIGRELIESTRKKAIERGLPIAPALSDCFDELKIMIETIFNRMAEIEQRLNGKGYPKSIPKKDVSDQIQKNVDFLQLIINSEINSSVSSHSNSGWWLNVLELKPNFCGVGLNLNFLFDWFKKKKTNCSSTPRRKGR